MKEGILIRVHSDSVVAYIGVRKYVSYSFGCEDDMLDFLLEVISKVGVDERYDEVILNHIVKQVVINGCMHNGMLKVYVYVVVEHNDKICILDETRVGDSGLKEWLKICDIFSKQT
jgi:hypothetical protein